MTPIIPPSGILIVDKPQGWTSHDVVAKVRRILQTKKVGHAGTLDPMATGVLVVLVGKATKLSDRLLSEDKIYQAEILLGQQTDSGDADGRQIKEDETAKAIIAEQVAAVLPRLKGSREQQVPMHAAVKINGQKLYKLTHKGLVMAERPTRLITIARLDMTGFSPVESGGSDWPVVSIEVECSKGTYIRVLGEEIAAELGTVGHLISLRRLASGQFSLAEAVTMDSLLGHANPASLLLPIPV